MVSWLLGAYIEDLAGCRHEYLKNQAESDNASLHMVYPGIPYFRRQRHFAATFIKKVGRLQKMEQVLCEPSDNSLTSILLSLFDLILKLN